jgi:predicted nucleic acid-binding protein
MTVTFDTSAWIEYFLGSDIGQLPRSYVDGDEPIATSAISLMEIKDKYVREGRSWKDRVAFIASRSEIVPLDEKLALAAADVKHSLRLHTTDSIIYATAQAAGSKLLTKDSHFKGMKNVVMLE